MKKILLINFIFIISAISLAAQEKIETTTKDKQVAQTFPANFKTDGCTHFPDADYLDCCIQHDLAYFNGGTWKQRWNADGKLRKCVAAKNGWWHKPVSLMMWSGVRIGGAPFLNKSFSWGFGKQASKTPAITKSSDIKTSDIK